MKVAQKDKKANPSKLIKPRTFKAGASETKQKKTTLLKGFFEATSLSGKAVQKTANGYKPTLVKYASSPGGSKKSSPQKKNLSSKGNDVEPKKFFPKQIERLATPKRKSLAATPSTNNKGSAGGKTLSPAMQSPSFDDEADKALKSAKMKKLSSSMPSMKVRQKTVEDECSTPKQVNKTPIHRAQKLDKLKLLKRQSLVSSPRNSFVVKPLERNATPDVRSGKSSGSQRKSTAVSTPTTSDHPLSDQSVKSAKKSIVKRQSLAVMTSPQDSSVKIFSPLSKPAKNSTLKERTSTDTNNKVSTPALGGGKQSRISLPGKKSKIGSTPDKSCQTSVCVTELPKAKINPAAKSSPYLTRGKDSTSTKTVPETLETLVNRKSYAVPSTPVVIEESKALSPVLDSVSVKKSVLKKKSIHVSPVGVEDSKCVAPASESKSKKKILLKRKSLVGATPSGKSKAGSQVPSPPKIARQSDGSIKGKNNESIKKAIATTTPNHNAIKVEKGSLEPAAEESTLKEIKTGPQSSLPQPQPGDSRRNLKRKSTSTTKARKQPSVEAVEKTEALPKKGSVIPADKKSKMPSAKSNEPLAKRAKMHLESKTNVPSEIKAPEKKTVEPADVSKDPRLQNLEDAAEAVVKVAREKLTVLFKKNLLAGGVQPIYLQIHSVRVPKTAPRTVRFNLPHSIYEKTADICLILGDPIKGRKRDTEQEVIVEDYKEMLQNKGVRNIKEVIPFSYLRSQYNQYEMKRRFANSYDVVLCDSRFIGHATHFLGKPFFSSKCLTPVRLVKEGEKEFVDDFKSAIDFALHKTWMRLHSKGPSFSVIVGNTEQTTQEIAANALAIFNHLQVVFPGGLDNIKMAVFKAHESHPVPVFTSMKSHDEIPVPVVKAPQDKLGKPATDELSTIPGRVVTVYPGGRIDLRSKMTPEDVEYEEIMGHESKWKRSQKRLKEQEALGAEEEPKQNMKAIFSRKGKPGLGKKPFQGKKFSPKKTFPPGKKVFSGKKVPPGRKMNLTKKGLGKKTRKQGKGLQNS